MTGVNLKLHLVSSVIGVLVPDTDLIFNLCKYKVCYLITEQRMLMKGYLCVFLLGLKI